MRDCVDPDDVNPGLGTALDAMDRYLGGDHLFDCGRNIQKSTAYPPEIPTGSFSDLFQTDAFQDSAALALSQAIVLYRIVVSPACSGNVELLDCYGRKLVRGRRRKLRSLGAYFSVDEFSEGFGKACETYYLMITFRLTEVRFDPTFLAPNTAWFPHVWSTKELS